MYGGPRLSTKVSPTARRSICWLSCIVIVFGPRKDVGVTIGPLVAAGPIVAACTIAVTGLPRIGSLVAPAVAAGTTMFASPWPVGAIVRAGDGVSSMVGGSCDGGIGSEVLDGGTGTVGAAASGDS